MKKKKRKNYKKRIIGTAIIAIFLWITGFYIYITYQNIEIDTTDYETTRLQSTTNEQTVESEEENSQKVADIIEETTRKVVGISKKSFEKNYRFLKNSIEKVARFAYTTFKGGGNHAETKD